MPTPRDAALYATVKAEAKRRFARWPSAYGSAWLSQEYRRRGGRWSRSKKRSAGSVTRWMREEWVQVEPYLAGRRVPCGATPGAAKACRPTRRVSKRTPPTLDEVVRAHGKARVRALARAKRRSGMDARVDWRRGRVASSPTKS
jgi:hypothetical protein